MVFHSVLVGLIFGALAGILYAAAASRGGKKAARTPPLPPRTGTASSRNGARASAAASNMTRTIASTAAVNSPPDAALRGPRGQRHTDFPCCPYDHQRNLPGGPVLIRWDGVSDCYRCSRGHSFRSNGRPL